MNPRPVSLPFADRADAGRRLAERVRPFTVADPIVLALPRGGVAVGAELARALHLPLDVLLVRKIGLPGQPELGVGALAEDGHVTFDDETLARLGVSRERLTATVEAERRELHRRRQEYRRDRDAPPLAERDVLVVDDGLATGASALAALRMVRRHHPARLVLAVPVGSTSAADRLRTETDHVVLLSAPENFQAVGEWYRDFAQLSDADVTGLLTELEKPPARSEQERAVRIKADDVHLDGDLVVPPYARGCVVAAFERGRRQARPQHLVAKLTDRGYATLALDLVNLYESYEAPTTASPGVGVTGDCDTDTGGGRHGMAVAVNPAVEHLAYRLQVAVRWLRRSITPARNPVGVLGMGTSSAPVLLAAARAPTDIAAVVVAGGRMDHAESALADVHAPTLALVEGTDSVVYELAAWATRRIGAHHDLRRIPGAEVLLAEPGQAEQEIAAVAGDWFERHL